jgi:hypothetical protein
VREEQKGQGVKADEAVLVRHPGALYSGSAASKGHRRPCKGSAAAGWQNASHQYKSPRGAPRGLIGFQSSALRHIHFLFLGDRAQLIHDPDIELPDSLLGDA